MPTMNPDVSLEQLAGHAEFLHAYLECSDEIQEGIKDMMRILFDSASTDQERNMANATLADALLPNSHIVQLGMELEESEQGAADHIPGFTDVAKELDSEEEAFAKQLKTHMALRNINQSELAEMIGVGQPAISNMLKRQCRPQSRTITKLAQALGVAESELWLNSNDLKPG